MKRSYAATHTSPQHRDSYRYCLSIYPNNYSTEKSYLQAANDSRP